MRNPAVADGGIEATATPPRRRAVAAWILYDLANTIFSIAIVSNYFPIWVVDDMGGRDADVGLANGAATALVLVSAPFLGALSDRRLGRIPLLIASTAVCCTLTALLGSGGLGTSLLLFVGASYAFQTGLIFYDALLPAVSSESDRGRIGGLGVGIGYVGSLIGIGVGLAVLSAGGQEPVIFRLTALLFALFAVPCFVWVRERPRSARDAEGGLDGGDLLGSFRGLARYPDLRRLLLGRVLYANAANTLILYMGIYATAELGFGDREKDLLLLVGILAAIAGGLGWGRTVDRSGPKRALSAVLALWAVTLLAAGAIPSLGLPKAWFWPVAALAGVALGGTWTADRPFMLRLTPPAHLGRFFGLYAMAGRFAAIIGPVVWALVVDGLGWGRPAAVLGLLAMVAAAAWVLAPIDDAPRRWSNGDEAPVLHGSRVPPSSPGVP
jgi:UMF1 family MFS transporter